MVPNFAFGFLENGEGGSRRTWFLKKSGRRRGGPRISKATAVRTRKRTARDVLEPDHWWTYARIVVCIRPRVCGVGCLLYGFVG